MLEATLSAIMGLDMAFNPDSEKLTPELKEQISKYEQLLVTIKENQNQDLLSHTINAKQFLEEIWKYFPAELYKTLCTQPDELN